jgi:hypothetical protein
MRPPLPLLAAFLFVGTACGGPSGAALPASTAQVTSLPTPSSGSASATDTDVAETVAPSPAPDHVSSLVPPLFEDDVPSGDVPVAALVPLQTNVIGSWYLGSADGEAIVVAWEAPGPDPIFAPRGVVVWRRYDDGGAPWRPIYSDEYVEDRQVLGVLVRTGDMTGDGSDDVLIDGVSGITSNCGSYALVDVVDAEAVFTREGCDLTIEPVDDPVGLEISESVFRPGDAHCCPSATRTVVLTYAGEGRWTRVSRTVGET